MKDDRKMVTTEKVKSGVFDYACLIKLLYIEVLFYYIYSNSLNSTKITLFQKYHGKHSEGVRCFLVLGFVQIKWGF